MSHEEIEKRLGEDHLLGAVRKGGILYFYLNPVAYWIMDSVSYDPSFKQEDYPDAVFRSNVAVVQSSNAEAFLNAIKEDTITLNEITSYLSANADPRMALVFLIDFDQKIFVSAFPYIETEKYIPSDWIGKSGLPVDYLAEEIAAIFPPVNL